MSNLESSKRSGTTVLINPQYKQSLEPGEYVAQFEPLTEEQQEILGWPACGEILGVSVYSTRGPDGINGAMTIARGRDSGRQWESHEVTSIWSDWVLIATATPPQEFSLPLAAGIDAYGKSTYCKTQEGICFVNIAAHSSSDGIMDQSIIATLPAGFRPDMVTYAAGHGFTNAGTRIPLDVGVNPDGTIQIWVASTLEYCSCFVGFVAAS